MSFSINKLLIVILVAVVVGVVLLFLFKVDITKYFEFLPDFDANKEDKIIEGALTSEEQLAKQNEKIFEQRKKIIFDFKKQDSFLTNRFREEELKKYEVPCILGVFDDPKLPEGDQLIIDFKKVTKGSIDIPEMVNELIRSSSNPVENNLIKERNEKALSELLDKSYKLHHNKLCLSQKFEISGNLEDDKSELLRRLIDPLEYAKIKGLLECLNDIPANELLLTKLARDLGVVVLDVSSDPEFEIYYADNLGGFVDSRLIESIESRDFIVSSSGTVFNIIKPKIVITDSKILVYDTSYFKRIDGDLSDINLVIARYNGKNYLSTSAEKPLKPFCYSTIQN